MHEKSRAYAFRQRGHGWRFACSLTDAVRDPRGFTLIEMIATIAVFVILSAGSMALLGTVTPTIRTNSQVNRVLSLVQHGRESAITKQRRHVLRFDLEANSIALLRIEGVDEIPVETVAFEYGIQIMRFAGAPDTPDGFGNAAAVDFGDAEEIWFDSEGSLVDEEWLPRNGTIFLGMPGNPASARAITVTGATGRARFYVWNGNQEWEGGWLAK